MDEHREILYKKASTNLPDWPKGPNDFYVAILSHRKHVRSCEHKDLLWLKVRGKNTVAQVKAAHSRRVGRKVVLYDGRNVVTDDTQIRYLNHHRSDVVVFWTKRDEGREALARVTGKSVTIRNETSAMRNMRAESAKHRDPIHLSKDVLGDLTKGLEAINQHHEGTILKAEKGLRLYRVICSDCPVWTHYCPLQASPERIVDAVGIAAKHIDTDRHKHFVRHKFNRIKEIADELPDLYRRYPGSEFAVEVVPFKTEAPLVTCATCPEWKHQTFIGELLRMTMAMLEKHLKSRDHQNALDTEMEVAAEPIVQNDQPSTKPENEFVTLMEPPFEQSSDDDDFDAMDVDPKPRVKFPRHLLEKYKVIQLDDLDGLHCQECRVNITDPTTPAHVQISDAADHMNKAKHHCSFLSFLLSEMARVLDNPHRASSHAVRLKELIKKHVKKYPLAKLELAPVLRQNNVHVLQCIVCKGAGFHKYMFKNAVDKFAFASLRKAAHHLASDGHQRAAEEAAAAPSSTASKLAQHARFRGIESTKDQVASTSKSPHTRPGKPHITESHLITAARANHPVVAPAIEFAFRSFAHNKIDCEFCNRFYDNVCNGNLTKFTTFEILEPLDHVSNHAKAADLKEGLAHLSRPGLACVLETDMRDDGLTMTCRSCPTFSYQVLWSVNDAMITAEAHIAERKRLDNSAGPSNSTHHSNVLATQTLPLKQASSVLLTAMDNMCKKYSPESSIFVKDTQHKSPMCEIKCRDCLNWSFTSLFSAPSSLKSEKCLDLFRCVAKKHLRSKEHRVALKRRIDATAVATNASETGVFSANGGTEISARGIDEKDPAGVTNAQKSTSTFTLKMQKAQSVHERHFPDCSYCSGFFRSIAGHLKLPRALWHAFRHVYNHMHMAELEEELHKLYGPTTIVRMWGQNIRIMCNYCPGITYIQDNALAGTGWDNEFAAVESHVAEPEHVARQQSADRATATSGHPAASSSALPVSSPQPLPAHPAESPPEEPSSETLLIANSQKHFPEHASDIQEAFSKYTDGGVDCGKCEGVFEDISLMAPAKSENWDMDEVMAGVKHVISHMKRGDLAVSEEEEEETMSDRTESESNDKKEAEEEFTSIRVLEPKAHYLPSTIRDLAIQEISTNSKKFFPTQASAIRKAYLQYLDADVDCEECDHVLGCLSSVTAGRWEWTAEEAENGIGHLLEHVMGDDDIESEDGRKADSGEAVDEGEDEHESEEDTAEDDTSEEDSSEEDTEQNTTIIVLPPTATTTTPTTHPSLTPLHAKYPTSSFSLQKNARNEDCFTCLDCLRTLSSGASMRNYEQHLGSVAHRKIIAEK
ncbi:hypothetical protein WAI453_003656 [Rhynchosporium graminicola]